MTFLEGQPNFRDLGSLRAGNGSLVATGEVYRSGELSGLTDADLEALEHLRVRTVVDLRTEREAGLHPDRVPVSATYEPLPFLPGGRGSKVEKFLHTFDPADFPPWEDVYRMIIRRQSGVLASLIRRVADSDARPLLFHCSTGKDRTGIASALLLSILGVPWGDIEEDYLRSNTYLLPAKREMMDRWSRGLERHGIRVDAATRSRLEQFMAVDRSYLTAARDEMIALNGSVAGYVRDGLGLERKTEDSLRAQLLV